MEYRILWKYTPREKTVGQEDSRGSVEGYAVRIHLGGENSGENLALRIQFNRTTGGTSLEMKIKNRVA